MRYDSGWSQTPPTRAEVAQDPDFFDQLPYVNLNADPPRVRPRTIVDFALGYEGYRADRRLWEDRLSSFESDEPNGSVQLPVGVRGHSGGAAPRG